MDYAVPVEEYCTVPQRIRFPFGSVSAILSDIEGTTTSISFVHDVLFPYAKKNVAHYVVNHQQELAPILDEVKTISGNPQASLDEVIATLVAWMNQDKKITPLKTLQGMMWEEGYKQGDFQGHIYQDAYMLLKKWKEQGLPLYIYSSGSVHAQKLLYSHSTFGDMTPLFSGYFDTTTGPKKEANSYQSIAQSLGVPPQSILFLSDSVEELNAAQASGMQTVLLWREETPPPNCVHPLVKTFYQIYIE